MKSTDVLIAHQRESRAAGHFRLAPDLPCGFMPGAGHRVLADRIAIAKRSSAGKLQAILSGSNAMLPVPFASAPDYLARQVLW